MDRNKARILPEPTSDLPEGSSANKNDNHNKATAAQYEVRGIVGHILATWDKWAKERVSIEATWLRCEKAYLSKIDYSEGVPKWKSRAFIPASFNAVESIHAQIMSGIFPNERFFDIEATQEDHDVFASAAKEILVQQLYASGYRTEMSHFIKQLITIGNSAAIVDWSEETTDGKTIFAGSRLKVLDMKYFHIDPYASDPHRANKMRKYWLTVEEAEALDVFDKDALELLDSAQGGGAIQSAQEDANRIAAAQSAGYITGIDTDRGPLEITELWGTFEFDGEVYANHVVSVANGVMLRLAPSPYAHGRDPFVFSRYSVVAGEPYGIGALEPALPLQYLINSFTNQKVDELSIIINGMWKYTDDGVIDVDNLRSEPGAMFEVADMANLQPLQPTSAVALAYNEIQDLERKFEEATGAIKLVTGGTPQSTRTATEVMALTQSGNSRFNELLAHIEANAIQPSLQMYLGNAAQFMSDKQSVKIIGKNDEEEINAWVQVEASDLARQFLVRPGGSRLVAMREFRLRNMMTYLQTVGSIPQIAQGLDWGKVNKRIWKELGFDDEDDLMKEGGLQNQPPPQPQQAPQQPVQPNPQVAQMMEGMQGGLPDGAQ